MVKKEKIKQTFHKTRGRTYKNYNKNDFENIILNDDRWLQFWDPDLPIDEMWHTMFDIIVEAADACCPMINMKIVNNNPEWFNQEILEEIHLKDERFRQFERTKNPLDWNNFKGQNNRVKNLIKAGKEGFIKDQLNQNSGNPSKFWQHINNTRSTGFGKNITSTDKINPVDENGNDLQGNAAVDFMNEYYANAGFNLQNAFKTTWVPNIKVRLRG